MYDAVVIGAGMSGLGAGIRLAHFQKCVCVVEKHALWGGLNSFYKKAGKPFDVGLHAMTNYARRGQRGPLASICRQLRLDWDELKLCPQTQSSVRFPSAQLSFSNDLALLESEIERAFPGSIDSFRRLCDAIREYDDGTLQPRKCLARARVSEFIHEPLLIEMLLCPLMFYGSATEGDMDWHAFVILFKSVYFEGFCRPDGGVRHLLGILRREFLARGGELRLKTGVRRLVAGDGGVRVELDSGEIILARRVLSSAGKAETEGLLGVCASPAGRLGFVETLFCVNEAPKEWGWEDAILFFSHRDDFQYREPQGLIDASSGIVCCPTNFVGQAHPPEPMVRVTSLASYERWKAIRALGEAAYASAKSDFQSAQLDAVARWFPALAQRVHYRDSFTPLTVERFTSHVNGAVYGAPEKSMKGETGVPGVYLCGTDQGYLGIVGAVLSGVVMANHWVLREA